eukprot:scaffold14284_cov101-Isochrysis_galbana.AAC.2
MCRRHSHRGHRAGAVGPAGIHQLAIGPPSGSVVVRQRKVHWRRRRVPHPPGSPAHQRRPAASCFRAWCFYYNIAPVNVNDPNLTATGERGESRGARL